MKFATWNVSSLAVRLPQLLAWLQAHPVDAIALQETKLTDDKFPSAQIEAAGYCVQCFGQKTYTSSPTSCAGSTRCANGCTANSSVIRNSC